MPIPNYSVLKGDPQPGTVTGTNPHYRVPVNTAGGNYTIDVNVRSVDGSEVLYAILENITPPNADALLALPDGHNPPDGLALDYVRTELDGAPLITLAAMTPLATGDSKTLHDQIEIVVNKAIADEQGLVYAFGSFYADPTGVEGIHDIHMNQGNPIRNHGGDNGINQDGALYVYLPGTATWICVFIAFQTQSWNTDDQGNPL
jgi:uncharacterized protein YukJ